MFMQKLNSDIDLFLKMGQTRPLFVYFAIFVDGVLGSRTRGGRIEGADESTELPMAAPVFLISWYEFFKAP